MDATAPTDRALLWAVGSHRFDASACKSRTCTELRDSLGSAVTMSSGAAFVVFHDGCVTCELIVALSKVLRQVPCDSIDDVDGTSADSPCALGARRLLPDQIYLARINATAYGLDVVQKDFFFKGTRKSTSKMDSLCARSCVRNRMNAVSCGTNKALAQNCSSPARSIHIRMYAEILGLGAWFRYIADQLLLPLGVRQLLYLDLDTCILGDLAPMFTANESVPLVVAPRSDDFWRQRQFLWNRVYNRTAARVQFGFELGDKQRPKGFNNGVMQLNLVPYCRAGMWGRLKRLARLQAHAQTRVLKWPHEIDEMGDNTAIEIVASGDHVHYVGREYNCRRGLDDAVGTRKLPCRIRHLHELDDRGSKTWWLNGGAFRTHRCSLLTAKRRSEGGVNVSRASEDLKSIP